MASKKDVHVVPRPAGWAVKVEGNSKASSVHSTKSEATNVGRERAKQERSELVIHNKDGKISDSDSFGRDPHPPKDTKR